MLSCKSAARTMASRPFVILMSAWIVMFCASTDSVARRAIAEEEQLELMEPASEELLESVDEFLDSALAELQQSSPPSWIGPLLEQELISRNGQALSQARASGSRAWGLLVLARARLDTARLVAARLGTGWTLDEAALVQVQQQGEELIEAVDDLLKQGCGCTPPASLEAQVSEALRFWFGAASERPLCDWFGTVLPTQGLEDLRAAIVGAGADYSAVFQAESGVVPEDVAHQRASRAAVARVWVSVHRVFAAHAVQGSEIDEAIPEPLLQTATILTNELQTLESQAEPLESVVASHRNALIAQGILADVVEQSIP